MCLHDQRFATLHFTLGNQSNSATVGHAEAPLPISDAQRKAIVDFQTGLFTAQIFDRRSVFDDTGCARRVVALSTKRFTSASTTHSKVTIERTRRSRLRR